MRVDKYHLAPYIGRFCGRHLSGSKDEKILSYPFFVHNLNVELWRDWMKIMSLVCGLKEDLHSNCILSTVVRRAGYGGWTVLDFLSAWGLAAICEELLSTTLSDIELLLDWISDQWKCRDIDMRSSIAWNPEDLQILTSRVVLRRSILLSDSAKRRLPNCFYPTVLMPIIDSDY